MNPGGRLEHYRRGDLRFDVMDIGPADGTAVGFLHGFPQFNTSWAPVMEQLARAGLPLPGTQPAGLLIRCPAAAPTGLRR